jgi:hypothetical protein
MNKVVAILDMLILLACLALLVVGVAAQSLVDVAAAATLLLVGWMWNSA